MRMRVVTLVQGESQRGARIARPAKDAVKVQSQPARLDVNAINNNNNNRAALSLPSTHQGSACLRALLFCISSSARTAPRRGTIETSFSKKIFTADGRWEDLFAKR